MAQEEYKKSGYKIIAANFFNKKGLRLGEIDFIAINTKKIIFAEVKTRSSTSGRFGSGAEAVNTFKQIKILKAVKIFLQKNPQYVPLQPQIDVCLVEPSQLDPVRNGGGSANFKGKITQSVSNGVDKNEYSVKILMNAVDDWN